ncbi:MAG TPA: asparagine synthase (glutamine-hydrolyzing), partial [Thermoleophilaceae bacterium]|nr:asparagine synthase (glutamine-hydrolyzing) [Thermoleophilaceae bacterium]
RGHVFATGSDSEVAVHAYEEHGPGFVRELNGIFALVIWDARKRTLLAARDEFGVKPLYWWSDGSRLAVASEVAALLAAGVVTPVVDRTALDHYLACRFVPAPRTLFEGVSKLPAASLLVAAEGKPARVDCYREPPGEPLEGAGEDELAAELAQRFETAVRRQMMSDVPYGAFLSGGVDSAAVVAAMARSDAGPPATFTIGFPGQGGAVDEREYAATSARVIGTRHSDTAMEATGFLEELGRSVPRLEEPCGIPSAGALLQLSRFAARSVKVVLAGQGADEPHGGYGRHQAAAVLRHLTGPLGRAARPLMSAAGSLPRAERARRLSHLLRGSTDAQRLTRLVEITDHGQRSRLTGGPGHHAEQERLDLAETVLADVSGRDLLERALYLDTRMFLPDGILICNDKMSMAASLELRVPFLDVELMRFVERLPARLRVRPRAGKRLHRRAMRRLLPREIVDRPKHGFATPYDHWLRESLGEEVERRYAPASPMAELVDPRAAAALVDEHRRGRADHKAVLFCLLELSEWHGAFVEQREQIAA